MLKEKNLDMPLKLEAKQKRKKDQLGLEIFELRKEMGSILQNSIVQN